ncbi:MAG TPA: SusC/RagA family TonB-linked outer membrane protein [Balneolaceae bacterium]|nr:SusC/RagA family TonB-linked outer membrane protein [Balneolaceae bacterium]
MNTKVKDSHSISLFFLILFFLIGYIPKLKAQNFQVSGRVTDAGSGNTLPGVNIKVKGTTNGTTTNSKGHYSLSVTSSRDTLIFSYIGYKSQTIPIRGRSTINVQLSSSTLKGQQVVVTALGIKRKSRDLGYSVSKVSGQQLESAHAINPISALQGKAAGLDIQNSDGGVFGGTGITIRGESTLNGNNMPIFVVDGVILQNKTSGASEWSAGPNDYGNQIRNINPNNIQSISILKGSAATALYGSQAINGAVVITTKHGLKNQGLGISVNETVGENYVYATPDLQNEYGPGPLAGYVGYGKKDSNGNYYRFDTNQFHYNTRNGKQVPSLIGWFGAAYGMQYGPKFSSLNKIEGYDHTMVPYRAHPNNWKNAYRNGLYNNTNVTITGGSSNGSYYFNFGTKTNNGVYPKERLNDYSGMFKSTYDVTDYLTVHGSISYMRSIPQNPPTNIGQAFTAYTFSRAYNTKKYDRPSVFKATHGGVPSTQFGDKYGNVPGNSLWFNIYEHNQHRVENTWRPIASITAKPTKWLSLTLNGNMNLYNYRFSVKNLGSGYRNSGNSNETGGYYKLEHHSQEEFTGKFKAHIKHNFKNYGIDATLGGQIYHTQTSDNGANTQGGLVVPGRYFLSNSKQKLNSYGSVSNEKQINSLFALVNLSWNDQLYLDLTGRNDWSSALVYADGSGNYSYFYPSVSLSWIFNQTLNLPSWFSFGKLRASWARVGNDTSPYSINQGYGLNNIQTSSGYIYSNTINRTLISPNLKPEQKRSWEFGTNLKFFNNRVGLDFTYYKDNTFNQILNIPAPQVSGITSQKINAGNIQNQGIEASLKLTPVVTHNFSWNFKFNYTRNRNKIISLHSGVGQYKLLAGYPNYGNYRIGSAAYIGGSYGTLLSDILPARYQATDANGNPVSDPNNGKKVLVYSTTTRSAYYKRSGKIQKVGSIQPNFLGSITNTLHYKNLSLSFLIHARFGGDVASFTNRYGTAWGFLKTSLKGRDKAHGGITWTSQYPSTKGRTYHDGVIPKGVFAKGTTVTTPDGKKVDVGGMTFKQAYKKGYVEPSHASSVTYFNNSWGNGTINSNWFYKLSYVQLRNIALNYTLPVSVAQQIGAQKISVGVQAKNVLYFYNSSPNNMNPQTFRGDQQDYSYFERTPKPYTRSLFFNVNLSF